MTTPAVHELAGYPMSCTTTGGVEVVVRPMVATDQGDLLEFFRRLSAEDRFSLKEDVTDPKVIQRWAETLDYDRVLPLLAIADGAIIADGTLHRLRAGSRRHIGELRVVVDPGFRNRGVGRELLQHLIEVAQRRGLEKLIFEVVAETEAAAQHTAQALGFIPVAVLPYQAVDTHGNVHHVLVMETSLPKETEGGSGFA